MAVFKVENGIYKKAVEKEVFLRAFKINKGKIKEKGTSGNFVFDVDNVDEGFLTPVLVLAEEKDSFEGQSFL